VGRIVPGMTRRVAPQDRWQSSNLASPTLWALGRDRPPTWPRRELAYLTDQEVLPGQLRSRHPTSRCPPVWPRRRCLIGPTLASNRPITSSRSTSSVTATIPDTGVNVGSGAPIRTRRRKGRRPRRLPTR
jgi:hypothetical protein